ncbi:MAG: hypothetical protein WAQ57_02430 [Candidatus Saccharimonadales bacterium]
MKIKQNKKQTIRSVKFKKYIPLMATVAAFGLIGLATQAFSRAASPTKISWVVVPHEDDELEAWSMIQDTPGDYKLFIYLTRGEETGYCSSNLSGLNTTKGELAPSPIPGSKWTQSCETARISSTLNFFSQMNNTDATLPSDPVFYKQSVQFPANGVNVQRCDNHNGTQLPVCGGTAITDRSALVYSGGTYGRFIFFNLGDGDVTKEEAKWAIDIVMNNKTTLGVPTNISSSNLLGASFSNMKTTTSVCKQYAHADHRAVHDALWNHNFTAFSGYQAAATCAADTDASLHKSISDARWNDAFGLYTNGTAYGAYHKHYGWLWPNLYSFDATHQGTVVHKNQHFWKRY